MKRSDRRSDCPINFAVEILGDPWTLLVLRDLMFTERRTYSDFLRAEERCSTNILSGRLKHLQAHGLIEKRGEGRGAPYGLTAKGLDLLPAMLELITWSARYDAHTAAPASFVAAIRSNRKRMIADHRHRLKPAARGSKK